MEGQCTFPAEWSMPPPPLPKQPAVTGQEPVQQQEEEGGSYISAQKTFLMDGPEVMDVSILKVTLERMWGPEGHGYFIGFSKKEQSYFILALPSFDVNIKKIREKVEDMQKCIAEMSESKDWSSMAVPAAKQ